ncbi:efflux RND transporter permease subunit, partial [Pontibacterium sp.]
MVLSEISIKRPVLATVMSLLVLLIGLIAFDRLTVREYPKIDLPVVTVETTYPGA